MKIEKKNIIDLVIATGLFVNLLVIIAILVFYFSR